MGKAVCGGRSRRRTTSSGGRRSVLPPKARVRRRKGDHPGPCSRGRARRPTAARLPNAGPAQLRWVRDGMWHKRVTRRRRNPARPHGVMPQRPGRPTDPMYCRPVQGAEMTTFDGVEVRFADAAQRSRRAAAAAKEELIQIVDATIVTWPQGSRKPKSEQLRSLTGVGAHWAGASGACCSGCCSSFRCWGSRSAPG